MPKRVPLKEVADGSANGEVATMPPPPATSSEARGERPWADTAHDAPFKPEVAERISKIAKGEEVVEWPPKDASPAWLSGREEALAGGPVTFNPHDEGTPEHTEWVEGWMKTQPEIKLAEDLEPHVQAALDEDAKQEPRRHPEGTYELFQGIPGKDDFKDEDVEYLDAPAIARIAGELIERCEEFKHLRGLDIRYFWKARGGTPNNKVRLGRAYQPDGLERQSLDFPVWVIWLAADNLRTVDATTRQVEACVYRQLKHCQNTKSGKPTHAPYDFEGFGTELQRYGAWNGDLVKMLEAAGRKPGPEVVQAAMDLTAPAKESTAEPEGEVDDEDGDESD